MQKQTKPTYEELEQEIERLRSALKPDSEPDSVPYDSAWRTEINDASHLLIPMVNEVFGEKYTGDEKVIFSPNEHFLNQQDGNTVRRITDTSFKIAGRILPGDSLAIIHTDSGTADSHYLLECESSASNEGVLIRIFEYSAQIGLDQESNLKNGKLTVRIPRSAVIFLRSNSNTPNEMEIVIVMESGRASSKVRVLKMADYGIDEIFEKKLFLLIPFYLFNFANRFKEIENDDGQIDQIKDVYKTIQERLNALVEENEKPNTNRYGTVDEFTRQLIIDMSKKVARNLAADYPKIREGVESIMGGQILDYEAKRIKNSGIEEGFTQGLNQGLTQGLTQVAERMILDGEPGEKILSYTALERDVIDAIGKRIKVHVIWNATTDTIAKNPSETTMKQHLI